jgi:hypothetical protein
MRADHHSAIPTHHSRERKQQPLLQLQERTVSAREANEGLSQPRLVGVAGCATTAGAQEPVGNGIGIAE